MMLRSNIGPAADREARRKLPRLMVGGLPLGGSGLGVLALKLTSKTIISVNARNDLREVKIHTHGWIMPQQDAAATAAEARSAGSETNEDSAQ